MTITKLLCEYVDDENKGYVTLGGVAWYVFVIACHLIYMVSVTVILGGTYFYGAWLSYHSALYSTGVSKLGGFCALWFAVVSILIIIVVGVCVAAKLASIRVVTCEREDGD
jgi:hypothetical protein